VSGEDPLAGENVSGAVSSVAGPPSTASLSPVPKVTLPAGSVCSTPSPSVTVNAFFEEIVSVF
jgi:hypothetical protein